MAVTGSSAWSPTSAAAGRRSVVSLLWAVPVVAAAVATLLLVSRARALEDGAAGVAREVRRLQDIRAPLAAVRETAGETDEVVRAFRQRHPGAEDAVSPPG